MLRDDGVAYLSWWRRAEEGGTNLVLRSIGADGSLSATRVLAHSSMSQPVDVPQMMAVGSGLLFAWTTFEDRDTVVHTFFADNQPQ